MKLTACVAFNGDCAEAFKAYEKILGGKIVMMVKNSEIPADTQNPTVPPDFIVHARLDAGKGTLMGMDYPPDKYQQARCTFVNASPETVAEAERMFHALADGGSVFMPLMPTFFSHAFAMLTDRYGVQWMINCDKSETMMEAR